MFFDEDLVNRLVRVMHNACRIKGFTLLGYSFLPEHCHLLVMPAAKRGFRNPRFEKQYTISDLMHSIKRNFSRDLHGGNFWQPRFYFRVVQTEQYLRTIVAYMENNYRKHMLPERFGHEPYVLIKEEQICEIFQ